MTGLRTRLDAVERRVGASEDAPRPADLPGHVTLAFRATTGRIAAWLQPSLVDASL